MSIDNFYLKGKVALITGSRRGIGKEIALTFAGVGADIAINDIVVEGGEMDSVVNEIKKLGRRAIAVQADVTKKDQIENLVKKVEDELGPIDILVNNVGGGKPPKMGTVVTLPRFLDFSEEDWDWEFNINFRHALLCSQVVSRGMIERKKGNIINISSIGGVRGEVYAYGAAKATLVRLTMGLALDLARYGIRCNAIQPGWVKTDMTQPIWSDPAELKKRSSWIPLGRIGAVPDVANCALFLASDASSFITGESIIVDGGYLLTYPEHMEYIKREV